MSAELWLVLRLVVMCVTAALAGMLTTVTLRDHRGPDRYLGWSVISTLLLGCLIVGLSILGRLP